MADYDDLVAAYKAMPSDDWLALGKALMTMMIVRKVTPTGVAAYDAGCSSLLCQLAVIKGEPLVGDPCHSRFVSEGFASLLD